MTTTANISTMEDDDARGTAGAWRGFPEGAWSDGIDVRDFIQRNYTPYDGDASFLAGPTPRTLGDLGPAHRDVPRGARARRLHDRRDHAVHHHGARARLHRQGLRGHRRPADRRAAQARDHAERRVAHGRQRARDLRLRGGPRPREDLHRVPQDPQRRRLRRLPAERPGRPLEPHHHRPARRVRPRPHHRRLPPRRPLRRRRPDPRQEAGAHRARHAALGRGRHPRPRGERRAGAGAGRAQADGRVLRLRHLPPRGERPRGRAVAVLRLPGRGEGAERRRDVARPHLDLPRHLPAARHRRGHAHGEPRPRRSSTTSSSSSASSASSAPPSTTPSSRATPPG